MNATANETLVSISDVEKAFEMYKKVLESEMARNVDNERFLLDDVATDIMGILRNEAKYQIAA